VSSTDLVRVIVNPEAGHGEGARLLGSLERASRQLGVKLRVKLTAHPGHATRLAAEAARREDAPLVVMGGDGTIGEVINGIAGREVILGIIAVGTGNDVARSLALPVNDPKRALEIISTGKVAEIDLGRAGCRYFASVLGVGFPVQVAAVANRIKRLKGPLVFFLAMYRALLRMKAVRIELELDGARIESDLTSIVIQNTPYTGGGLLIAPGAQLNDGLLDVITVDNIGKLDLMLNLPKLYKGKHLQHHAFSLSQCKSIKIRAKDRLPTMFDGDLFGHTPLEVTTEHRALKVIVKQ